jgi:hypothetical protein
MHAQDGALSSAHPTQVKLVEQVLRWGLELVLTDVDALVLREPFEYMDRCLRLSATDCHGLSWIVTDGGPTIE